MKVSGFTFIRNAIKYDYPVVESIKSILPVCDEFIVAVGNSDDDTLELIKSIDSGKIKIIETIWDDSLRQGGRVLALETDKAFQAITSGSDWAFYIQGDEVVHEKYHDTIRNAMAKWMDNPQVEGLLFNYLHFYGSYDYIGESSRWYRKEVRIIRNDKRIYSYKDAQGFRRDNEQKLRVKSVDAFVYHYGWVKEPKAMQDKQQSFHKLWHDDEWLEKNIQKGETFDYSGIDALSLFKGTHPELIKERIAGKNWKFDYNISKNNLGIKDKLKKAVETITGYRIGEFKNYIEI